MRELPTSSAYRDYETTTGAFLRGTRGEENAFMGYSSGTKRTEGWFYFHLGRKALDEVEKVVLSKSPLDALSCAALYSAANSGMPSTRTMFLVVDSLKSLPLDFLKNITNITVACTHDSAELQKAQAIKELLPQTTVAQPKTADWNTELLEYSQQYLMRTSEAQKKKNRGLER
jgi:hypothetical protein